MTRFIVIVFCCLACTIDNQPLTQEGQPITYHSKGNKNIQHNKLLVLQIEISDENGKTYIKTTPFEPLFILYDSTLEAGVIQEVLSQSQIGDSISFKISAGNLWTNTFEQPFPRGLTIKDLLKVRLKISTQIHEQFYNAFVNQLDSMRYVLRYQEEERELEKHVNLRCQNCKKLPEGIYYSIDSLTPDTTFSKEQVSISYTATKLDGTEIDRGNMTFTTGKGEVIPGVEICSGLLKPGDSALFYIPSRMAYRSTGNGIVVPPFTSLIFAVKLEKRKYVE